MQAGLLGSACSAASTACPGARDHRGRPLPNWPLTCSMYMYVYTVCTHSVYTYTYKHRYMHKHTYSMLYVYIYIYVYALYICIYIYMSTNMYACMYLVGVLWAIISRTCGVKVYTEDLAVDYHCQHPPGSFKRLSHS